MNLVWNCVTAGDKVEPLMINRLALKSIYIAYFQALDTAQEKSFTRIRITIVRYNPSMYVPMGTIDFKWFLLYLKRSNVIRHFHLLNVIRLLRLSYNLYLLSKVGLM